MFGQPKGKRDSPREAGLYSCSGGRIRLRADLGSVPSRPSIMHAAQVSQGSGFSLFKVSGCLGHRTLFVPVALCAYFLSPVEPRKEIHQTEVLLFRPDCLTLKTSRAHGLA